MSMAHAQLNVQEEIHLQLLDECRKNMKNWVYHQSMTKMVFYEW